MYFFSWYGVYDNPQDILAFRSSYFFTLIPGAFFTVPVLFFALGFTSTFSLLHNKPEGTGMSFKDALFFIGKRVARLLPFTLFMTGFCLTLGPKMGGGPYWDSIVKALKPCNDGLWWTPMLFVNNLFTSAGGFEDKFALEVVR